MKNYSSHKAQKGKTAYRTPSRVLSGFPEQFKKDFNNKLHKYKNYYFSDQYPYGKK